ncbi:hypothetical protein ABIF62_004589 [Bradyrhizobium japonicum]
MILDHADHHFGPLHVENLGEAAAMLRQPTFEPCGRRSPDVGVTRSSEHRPVGGRATINSRAFPSMVSERAASAPTQLIAYFAIDASAAVIGRSMSMAGQMIASNSALKATLQLKKRR